MEQKKTGQHRTEIRQLLKNYAVLDLLRGTGAAPCNMLDKLDEALERLRKLGEKNPDYQRQYELLKARCIDGLSLCELEERYRLTQSVLYRSLGRGLDFLAVLLNNPPPPAG